MISKLQSDVPSLTDHGSKTQYGAKSQSRKSILGPCHHFYLWAMSYECWDEIHALRLRGREPGVITSRGFSTSFNSANIVSMPHIIRTFA